MSQSRLPMRPEYASRFRCIGPKCEDTCCAGWSVYFDEAAWGKYQGIADGPLRVLIDENVERMLAGEDGSVPGQYARVRLTADQACPFLNEERLCRIQAEKGEAYLSRVCAQYPRIAHAIDGMEEMALSLSCPEAARLVLLTPDLFELGEHGADGRSPEEWQERPVAAEEIARAAGPVELVHYFWEIRAFTVKLLADRRYALWQRMFLLHFFARRMDALAAGDANRGFWEVLRDFAGAIASGTLGASMEAIPADLGLQLDLVLRLAGLKLPRAHVGQRFLETVAAFTQGIGNGPGATWGTLIAHYSEAHERWYGPFMRANPHILENLLLNTAFRTLFPFGHKGGKINREPAMAREYALLAAQFALMKGLLIGVAGFYREAFGAEHVVRTVQSAAKHFEHHTAFLEETYALLAASGLDNARGLTMLVRN